jgi:hypothetical protein
MGTNNMEGESQYWPIDVYEEMEGEQRDIYGMEIYQENPHRAQSNSSESRPHCARETRVAV